MGREFTGTVRITESDNLCGQCIAYSSYSFTTFAQEPPFWNLPKTENTRETFYFLLFFSFLFRFVFNAKILRACILRDSRPTEDKNS